MDYWEQEDVVREFAGRAPDRRLLELLDGYREPGRVRVLDVGCAGGRNTVLLAERGFDVHALDASLAMVEETRRRLVPILGAAEARLRVQHLRMNELGCYGAAAFDLLIALGVLHAARGWEEWQENTAAVARVLRPGGVLLVAAFTPETDLTGEGVHAVPEEPHTYDGLPGGRAVLLGAAELDAALAAHGLVAETPARLGITTTELGRRVSANGLYRRA